MNVSFANRQFYATNRYTLPSSSGPGHQVLILETPVRLRLGAPRNKFFRKKNLNAAGM